MAGLDDEAALFHNAVIVCSLYISREWPESGRSGRRTFQFDWDCWEHSGYGQLLFSDDG